MKALFFFVALVALSRSVLAADYEGNWVASWHSARSDIAGHGDLTISGSTGTWGYRTYQTASNGGDPCTRRPQPVVVESATDDQLVLRIEPALPGCKTWRWKLKRVEPGRMEGKFGGAQISFTKD